MRKLLDAIRTRFRKNVTVFAKTAGTKATAGGRAKATARPSVLTRIEELQWDLKDLRSDLRQFEDKSRLRDAELKRQIDSNAAATDEAINAAIAKAQGRYFGTRMLGFVFALFGLISPGRRKPHLGVRGLCAGCEGRLDSWPSVHAAFSRGAEI
jgi:hypothetical protein